MYGATPWQFTECLIKYVTAPTVASEVKPLVGDSLVSRARNTLTGYFLRSDCTHLLFIDSDLVFSGEHIARLVAHDVDLVAGFYPKKKDGALEWVCNVLPEPTQADERGLQSVRYMGTGFMLVRRNVFEAMIEALGKEIAYTADETGHQEWDFWGVGVHRFADGSRRFLSEDWMFCQRWLDLGGQVLADTRVILRHVGAATYPLQSQQAAFTHADCLPNPA